MVNYSVHVQFDTAAILTSSNLTRCGSPVQMEDHLCKSH